MAIPENDREDSLRKVELARNLAAEGDYESCLQLANELLSEDFNNAIALFLVGYCILKTERFGLAYNIFRRVAELQPNRSEPWNNAGMCHQETWNLEDAEKCFRKALQLEPENAAAMQNLALIYVNRCNPDEALRWVSLAEKKNASWEATDNKALALLMKRDWSGWKYYADTAGRHKQRQIRDYNGEPLWAGESGKVVIYGTQGLGDEIGFASVIPDAIKRAEVIIDCDHRLESLFRRSFPEAKVYGTRFKDRKWEDKADYSIPVDCLPALFRTKDEDFTGEAYLRPDPEGALQWRALFDTYKKPVIGIAWTGGINNTNKAARSLTLEDYLPIFKSVDAVWVSLEYRDRDDEIQAFKAKHGIEIKQWKRATQSKDYDDTASLVAELDLVVSVTTAVVHLAGALGKECWCLAPNKPRWFYGLEGDIPWYKSVKMFRQGKDWPIEQMAKLLSLRFS